MEPHIHALDNLSHAHWKVSFIRHLLQAHLASPWKGTLAWQAQHADFLHRLAAAEDELTLCKTAPAVLHQIVQGGRLDEYAHQRVSPQTPQLQTPQVEARDQAPVTVPVHAHASRRQSAAEGIPVSSSSRPDSQSQSQP